MNQTEYLALLEKDAVVLTECSNSNVKPHTHDFLEFAYVVKGRAEHTINGKTFIMSEGDYFLINRKDSHAYLSVSEEGFRIINCLFLPQFIDKTLAHAGTFREILDDYLVQFGYRKFSDRVTLQCYHDQDGFVGTLMQKMLSEYREKKPGYKEILRNCLISTLVCLLRNDTEDPEAGNEQITKYIKEYVAEHYTEPISLSELSKHLNFSLTHVSLTFKKDTAVSFRDYLIKVRMEKACQLLRTTKKTVTEISQLVGYADPAFFYRSFKKYLGLTPTEYRERKEEM